MLPPTPQPTHDTTRIDDTRIPAVRPLVTLALLQEWMPVTDDAERLVNNRRAAISRLLCLPPPCGGGLIGGQGTQ